MIRIIKLLSVFVFVIAVFSNCEDPKEEHYKRSEDLPPLIYKQLENAGNFKNFLRCIDKSGFKDVIGRSGYLTVFAPNDEAFAAYLAEKGITIEDIDSVKAREIVTYSTLYNGYRVDQFDRYQTGSFSPLADSLAFKRKTYYYKGFFYENITVENQTFLAAVFDNPLNSAVFNDDNNNKYIPVFNNDYFIRNHLKTTDYNYFFPNTNFSGKNVAGAEIILADNEAENGYFHVINKVLEPLPNLEEVITKGTSYSLFKNIMDTVKTYVYISDLEKKYNNLPVKAEPQAKGAYLKHYTGLLFNPNNENYFGTSNEGQINGYTIFVPDNQAVENIMKNRIAMYYANNDWHNLPLEILTDFINAHMFRNVIFPSSPTAGLNAFNESPSFDFANNIKEGIFCSNGIFYGSNAVMASNRYMTVFGDIYLNPQMTIFYYGVRMANMAENLRVVNNKYSLFLLNNDFFTKKEFEYNTARAGDPLYYKGKGTSNSPVWKPLDTLKSIVNMHVAKYIPDLSGKGCIETFFGDAIGYDNYKIFGSGNLDKGERIRCIPAPGSPINGNVFFVDSIITNSNKGVCFHIQKYFKSNLYWNYLSASTIYDAENNTIMGLKATSNYTILIPNDDAILKAKANKDLPANVDLDPDKIKYFIQLHIIKDKSLCADGSREGNGPFLTTMQTSEGSAKVIVTNTPDQLKFTDMKGNEATWVKEKSNVLGNKVIIHMIDNYLKF